MTSLTVRQVLARKILFSVLGIPWPVPPPTTDTFPLVRYLRDCPIPVRIKTEVFLLKIEFLEFFDYPIEGMQLKSLSIIIHGHRAEDPVC